MHILSDHLAVSRSRRATRLAACAPAVAMLWALLCSSPAAAATPIGAEVLDFVWRLNFSAQDKAMSSSMYRLGNNPYDGQMYYAPRYDAGNYLDLYQLYSPSLRDQMPSNSPDEASDQGYRNVGTIAYLFPDGSRAGTEQISRAYNATTGDHALTRPDETLPAYDPQPLEGYAYPRYGNDNTSLLELSGGGVTIRSNRVAGGSLWEWTHNGKQYVNVTDYGRQIQSAYFHPGYTDATGSYGKINPTEAGSRWSTSSAVAERQGSPLIEAYNVGPTQVTRAVPLEWHPEHLGGDEDHPVAWTNMLLGKNITLDYAGMGPVAHYETVLVAPADSSNAQIEIPTGYLRAEFDRYWSYDAGSEVLKEYALSYPDDIQQQFSPASGYGGVIISDSSLDYAMGVYGALTRVGGSVDYFTLWNFIDGTPDIDAYDRDTSKFAAVYGPGQILAGYEYTFTSWLMTGTLDEVTGYMDALYARGDLGEIRMRPVPEPATATLVLVGGLAVLGFTLRKRRRRRSR